MCHKSCSFELWHLVVFPMLQNEEGWINIFNTDNVTVSQFQQGEIRADKMREYVMNNPQLTCREFIIKHFSPLWD